MDEQSALSHRARDRGRGAGGRAVGLRQFDHAEIERRRVYDYGLTVAPFEHVSFNKNATITLSGLSGVTGASTLSGLSDGGFTVSSLTQSSAVYAQTVLANAGFTNPSTSPTTTGTLVVDSSVLTLGTVDFSTETTGGTVRGTTEGPVAPVAVPVPEPTSLVLLATALLGLADLARMKVSR